MHHTQKIQREGKREIKGKGVWLVDYGTDLAIPKSLLESSGHVVVAAT